MSVAARIPVLGLVAALSGACSPATADTATPEDPRDRAGIVSPVSASEQAALDVLRNDPPQAGEVRPLLDSISMSAGDAYTAASGQFCRPIALQVGQDVSNHLVCRHEESDWAFVPRVFGPAHGGER